MGESNSCAASSVKPMWGHSPQWFSKSFNPRKPSTDHWLNFFCGYSAFHISLTIKGKDRLGVEIYIPNDKSQYDQFEKSKVAIERELSFSLDWQPLPGKKAARIYCGTKIDWTRNREKCFAWLAKTAVAMKSAFCKFAE